MNVQSVVSAKPDLIVDVGTVNESYIALAAKIQKETGIPYVLIDGSLSRTPEALRQTGELLQVSPRAEELSSYAESVLKTLRDGIATIAPDRCPKVYYGRGPEGLETGLAGSINLDILDVVGATNVAAVVGKGELADISKEQVLGWNPHFLLASDSTFAQSVKASSDWSAVAAVQNGRVYTAPALPFGWIDAPPGVNRLIGVQWLETVLYPDVFKEGLGAEVRRFFKLFYQVDLTSGQLDGLLKAATPRPQ